MRKIAISICLLFAGLAIFMLGCPYYSVFPTNGSQLYALGLTAFFLVLWAVLKRSRSLSRYAPAAYALFIASAALLFLNTGILNIGSAPTDPVQDLARDKALQFLHVVPVLLALTLLARGDLKSIFVARGNLKAGLIFGGLSLLIWAILAFLLQTGADGAPQLNASTILSILIYAFGNAIMEELWFRAIFLKKYQVLIGRGATILVTSAVFAVPHLFATYEFPGGGLVFGAIVFALGVVGAYSMFKTDSIMGAILFHAGYDLTIIVSVLNSS